MSLLDVVDVHKTYPARGRLGRARERVTAVDGVTFSVEPGETFALVGESGAGKSTVGRLIARLVDADSGRIVFDGTDLLALDRTALRVMRRQIQMVFQDPYSSLDPRVSVGESVAEPLRVHFRMPRGERLQAATEWLERVGLSAQHLYRYPRELSGGQLQRACIARALTLHPKLIICDEPVAALDVSVQAQVLNLMYDLQQQLGLTYVFISHDLALVEAISDRVAVMADHRLVEVGTRHEIYHAPQSEYTRRLLDAIPVPIPKKLRKPTPVLGTPV